MLEIFRNLSNRQTSLAQERQAKVDRAEASRHAAIKMAGEAMSQLSNKDWIDVIVVCLIARIQDIPIEDIRALGNHFGQEADAEERRREQ